MAHGNHLMRFLALAAIAAALTGCAPSGYIVSSPTPSGQRFEGSAPPASELALVDARTIKVFSSGILPAQLSVAEGQVIDPMRYLAEHLQSEFASRGAPTKVVQDGKGMPRLTVRTFRMINHRTNAYAPFITMTYFAGDLETSAGTRRIGVFVKRGKVPVWSFQEVVEPTLTQPLSLVVKELAAKISRETYGSRGSDKSVDELVAKLGARGADSFLDVYALGFTNNPRAVSTLVSLTSDGDEYVRLAAISSLGTLRAAPQLAQLRSLYGGANLWQDRAMAIKAIGDLGTAESRALLEKEIASWSGQKGNEALWTRRVIELYLPGKESAPD
jgi:hypothetical protein